MSETKTLSELAHNEFEHRLGSEFLREAEKHTSKLPTMERVTRHDTKGAWSSLCFTFPGVRVHLFSHMVYPFMVERGDGQKTPFFTNDAATAAHTALRSYTHHG